MQRLDVLFGTMLKMRKRHLFPVLALLAGLIAFVLAAHLSLHIFQKYPFSQDEYTYLYQAQMFASGHLYRLVDSKLYFLVEHYVMLVDGRLFGKYPPGFPAVLMLGVLVKQAALVNPLLTAASAITLFAVVRRTCGVLTAFCCALMFATNPYVLGYGGSYFAQPLILTLTALTFGALQRYLQTGRRQALHAAGILTASAYLVRQLDAFCLMLAVAMGILAYAREKDRLASLCRFFLIAACGVLALFSYNYMVGKCFCVAPYPVWGGEFKIVDSSAHSLWANLQSVLGRYVDNLGWAWDNYINRFQRDMWPVLLLAALGVLRHYRKPLVVACLVYIALLVVLYNFHWGPGWAVYGARYWYPILAPLTLLAGYGCSVLRSIRFLGKIWGVRVLAAVSIAVMALQFVHYMGAEIRYAKRFRVVMELKKEIAQVCPPPTVVLLQPADTPPLSWPFFLAVKDFKRNPSLGMGKLDATLYIDQKQDRKAAKTIFPKRKLCRFDGVTN